MIVYMIDGRDLEILESAIEGAAYVRVAIDGGGLKIKREWGTWSPPLGHFDKTSNSCPDCGAQGMPVGHLECPTPRNRPDAYTVDSEGPWGAP